MPLLSGNNLVREALRLLGINRLALAIHDQCFPSLPDEETGRGSPYNRGAEEFLEFAAALGFDTIQYSPQGMTSRSDPSPYMGTVFGKNPLSLAPAKLMEFHEGALFTGRDWEEVRGNLAPRSRHRVDYSMAWSVYDRMMDRILTRFNSIGQRHPDLKHEYESWLSREMARSPSWMERYGVFEALARAEGTDDWTRWGNGIDLRLYSPLPGEERACRTRIDQLLKENARLLDRFCLTQFLLHRHHGDLLGRAHALGLDLLGDLQVGFSHPDLWAWKSVFLPGYLLGAPPSRTNPEGQPWGYPVIDPRLYHSTSSSGEATQGVGLAFFRARIAAMLEEFDGIRIDHPQGIVCPWVYRADAPDPFAAVQRGARLFSSPDLPDHPELTPFSLVRPDQLTDDPACPRYGDQWVATLEPEQVDRFAVLLDTVLKEAEARGAKRENILCEVLSTWPSPLRAVMEKRGLGRFCITQKTNPQDPHDLYRIENTRPSDWVMPGNHDTKPLRMMVREGWGGEWVHARGKMLAASLIPDSHERSHYLERITTEPRQFRQAIFAELFLGPARHVSVFFTDLFGMEEIYNRPGVVSEENWSLRVPPNYKALYAEGCRNGEAFDIRHSLALALRARRKELGWKAEELAKALEK